MKPIVTALAIAVLLMSSSPALGAICTWDASESPDCSFGTAANWSCNAVPGANDTAKINNSLTPACWPVLDQNRTVNNLKMDDAADLDVDGNTLEVTTTFTVESGATISITSTSTGGGITAGSFVMTGASTMTVSDCTVQTTS